MCLLARKLQIAEEDITCYKILERIALKTVELNSKGPLVADKPDKIYVTPYMRKIVELNQTYTEEHFSEAYTPENIDVCSVDAYALHTFITKEDAEKEVERLSYFFKLKGLQIIKCTIPKGSWYAVGEMAFSRKIDSYASEKLFISDIIA